MDTIITMSKCQHEGLVHTFAFNDTDTTIYCVYCAWETVETIKTSRISTNMIRPKPSKVNWDGVNAMDVIRYPLKHKHHFNRIKDANTIYPIIVTHEYDHYVIVDGCHRHVKQGLLPTRQCKVIPRCLMTPLL